MTTPQELKERMRGVAVVMITPFKSGTEIDEEALRSNTRFLIDNGIVEGQGVLIPGGSTGECYAMSIPEREQVFEIVVEEAGGRVPVVVGCNHSGADLVIDLVKRAERAGADGVMIIPPYYEEPTDHEIVDHYQTIADATGLGIMVYNNPWVVRKDLSLGVLARLFEIDQVVAIKDCSYFFFKTRETIRRFGDRIAVFACHGETYAPYDYDMGCVGQVSMVANFAPKLCVEIYKASMAGDFERARELVDKKIMPYFYATFDDMMPMYKETIRLAGRPIGDYLRPPMHPVSEEQRRKIKEALAEMGIKVSE